MRETGLVGAGIVGGRNSGRIRNERLSIRAKVDGNTMYLGR